MKLVRRAIPAIAFGSLLFVTTVAPAGEWTPPTKQSNAGDSISQGFGANGWPGDHPDLSWVQGTDDLPLKDLLADVGVEWREQEPSVSQRLGCRLQETPAGLKAQQVLRGGAAQSAGLAAGDELLALDDWRVRKSDDLHLLLRPGKRHALTVARDQRLLQLRLHVPERAAMAAATSVRLELSAHANAALLARRDAWLARA